MVCREMEFLGIQLDLAENNTRRRTIREINTSGSRVKVLIVPTNEELEIAEQCVALLGEEALR